MSPLPDSGSYADGTHVLPVRVYYEDTDFSGVVYHAAYLKFMERGRTESLRATGTTHQDLLRGETSLAFAVRHMDIDFHAPARIDAALEVHTRFLMARGARLQAEQAVVLGEQKLISAHVELACIDLGGRPRRIPKMALEKMSPFLYPKPT